MTGGDLGGRAGGVEPQRHAGMPEVVRSAGQWRGGHGVRIYLLWARNVRTLRRDWLGGLNREYAQVA